MSYRRDANLLIWHWCHNCSLWPASGFKEREDKPPTWTGQSLCEECKSRDYADGCQHSTEDAFARTGMTRRLQSFKIG